MAGRRSGKFYLKNEQEVMERLGLKQVPGSGSSWIAREDGENEDVLCQLKSTDADSIRIQRRDIEALKYHAGIAHKLPVFAIQFLQGDDVYLVVKPQDVIQLVEYLNVGYYTPSDSEDFWGLLRASEDSPSSTQREAVHTVKSSRGARDEFMDMNAKKFKKQERRAN